VFHATQQVEQMWAIDSFALEALFCKLKSLYDSPTDQVAAPENRDLCIIKAIRKPPKKLDLCPYFGILSNSSRQISSVIKQISAVINLSPIYLRIFFRHKRL
jgi:hypothetical protein